MRTLPSALAAHLSGEATTLCRCWSLTRRDGAVLGFTDHDQDLAFDGILYRAGSGLEAAEATAELGFATGGGEVLGAFVASGLSEAELKRAPVLAIQSLEGEAAEAKLIELRRWLVANGATSRDAVVREEDKPPVENDEA